MSDVVPILTVDLSQCSTKDRPEEDHYGKQSYLVVGREDPDDIYLALHIIANLYDVFVDIKRSSRAFHDGNYNSAFIFSPGMKIYLYIEEKKITNESYRAHYSQPNNSIHLSIPNTVRKVEGVTFRESSHSYNDKYTATLTISAGDAASRVYISCRPEIAEAVFRMSFSQHGTVVMGEQLGTITEPNSFYQRYTSEPVDFSLKSLFTLMGYVEQESNIHQLMCLLKQRDELVGTALMVPAGNKKVLEQMIPFYEELLAEDEPILLAVFQTLVFECKRTINSVKVSKWFNEFFSPVRDMEHFKANLKEIYSAYAKYESEQTYRHYKFDDLFATFHGYTELLKQALRSKSGRALTKMVTDIEAIKFDEEKCPILASLIHDGSIPVSTFFRKEGDETYFLFNDNWDLFEQFLGKHRDAAIKLAELASKRTTYEKSFMSYMYFILYDLPEYLEKHTGKKWTCFPSIVESAHELEPGRTDLGQTTKRRSALTPIVDNEACTVVVPYACLKVYGMNTTYTYSLNYSLIRRGLSLDGCVATKDVEEKLNGCDDYGLMFYTLTGSVVGRGYPTFLIIFERLNEDTTRVHFHRTHPLRSKDGDSNPLNNWIRTCYNWMVGNINMAGIKVQQGDLVFVSAESLPEGEPTPVNSYDSHTFSSPVLFIPCTKKDSQNILGYFNITEDVSLTHTEHRERYIPAGYYELRQCRSWEANPKGIWTLRID